jgi:hypothetical protein
MQHTSALVRRVAPDAEMIGGIVWKRHGSIRASEDTIGQIKSKLNRFARSSTRLAVLGRLLGSLFQRLLRTAADLDFV